MSVSLKGISEGVTPIATTNSPETLRKALALLVTSTAKSDALVKEIESIISLTPDQVAEKLQKGGLLFLPPQMILPVTFDKTTQKISPAELDVLLAQRQAVKVDELKVLLKPDERELTVGKAAYLQRACRNLSTELKLLYACLLDTDRALSANIVALNYLLRDENSKMTLLKRDIATSPVADGATK